MTFRLLAFSELRLTTAAIYLDTDMLVVAPLDVKGLLGENDVALCLREFGTQDTINTSFKGMNLIEYQGKTFGEVECAGRSELYERLSIAISNDPELLAIASNGRVLISNLFFAAVHYLLLREPTAPLALPQTGVAGVVVAPAQVGVQPAGEHGVVRVVGVVEDEVAQRPEVTVDGIGP